MLIDTLEANQSAASSQARQAQLDSSHQQHLHRRCMAQHDTTHSPKRATDQGQLTVRSHRSSWPQPTRLQPPARPPTAPTPKALPTIHSSKPTLQSLAASHSSTRATSHIYISLFRICSRPAWPTRTGARGPVTTAAPPALDVALPLRLLSSPAVPSPTLGLFCEVARLAARDSVIGLPKWLTPVARPGEDAPGSRRPKGFLEYWMRMPPLSLLVSTAPCGHRGRVTGGGG